MNQSEYQFRIAEIDVAKNATDDKIVGIFRYENVGAMKQGPMLLIVAEIHSTLYVYERLLDIINSTAEQARYLVSGVDQDPVGRFEKLVQRLNEAVSTFSQAEPNPISWNRVNLYVLELSKGHMCVTGIGKLMNLFLQKQDDGAFRSFDLLGSLEQPAEIDAHKPFASLICGDINPGDILIIGSSNLDHLRAELRFKERVTAMPPVTAALEIRQDLEKRTVPDHFIASIISCHEIKIPIQEQHPVEAEPVPPSTASVEKLREAEQEAAQHLSPVVSPLSPSVTFKTIAEKLKHITQNLLSRIRIPRRGQARDPDAIALASLRGMNAGYGSMFTKQRKLLLAAIGGGVLCIGIGIFWWNHAKQVAAMNAAWNADFDQAQDNRNRAESDLIYGNEGRARSELETATELSTKLTEDSAEHRTKLEKLKQDLSHLKEQLKKVTVVSTVTELTLLPPGSAENSLLAPILSKDTAYAVDTAESGILKINLSTKEVKRIAIGSAISSIVATTEGTSEMLIASRQAGLVRLSKNDDTLSAVGWSHTKTSSTQDILLYASKLYSLDPAQNQIWRSLRTDQGFGSETGYIKAADTSLEGAVAMAIDSNVYVLKNDGTVLKFLSGGQEGFQLATIDPPLRAASGIWTSVESANIYIADPADKRILIFDKNGELKAQLTSPQFQSPRDISVDEGNKRMIVVDGNRLLLVPLQ